MAENEPFMTFVDPNDVPNEPEQPTETPVVDKPILSTPVVTETITTPVHQQAMIRTYHQDVAGIMGQNNPKIMSDILANAHTAEAEAEAKNPISPKNKNYIIASISLLLLGLGSIGFALYRNYSTIQTLRQSEQLSLIRAENHTNVILSDNELFKNRNRVTQALTTTVSLQTINHIFFTKQTITGLARLGFTDLVQSTGGSIPQNLAATIDPNFMYGTYQSNNPFPFLILRVQKYDDAFSGMRAWEPLMVDHLGFLFNLPETLQANFNKSRFEDRIIANHTVRAVLYTPEPSVVFEETPNEILLSLPETEIATGTATGNETTTEETNETIQPIENITMASATENTIALETTTTEQLVNQEQTETDTPYQEGDTVLMYTFLNERTILITTSESVLREILFRLTNAQLLI